MQQPLFLPQIPLINAELCAHLHNLRENRSQPYSLPSHLWDGKRQDTPPTHSYRAVLQRIH